MRRSSRYSLIGLATDIYAGKLLRVTGYPSGGRSAFGRWEGETAHALVGKAVPIDLSAPSLDFGHLLDRDHSDFIGSEAFDWLLAHGFRMLDNATLSLPHPQCAYLHHCVEDAEDYSRTYCVALRQDIENISGQQFFRQAVPPMNKLDCWIMDCGSFEISGSRAIEIRFDVPVQSIRLALEVRKQQTQRTVHDVIASTVLLDPLLALASTTTPRSFQVGKYNQSRKLGQAKIAPPTIVQLDRAALRAAMDRSPQPAAL